MNDEIKEILARLDAIEAKQDKSNKFLEQLGIIILGSEILRVPGVVDQMRELYSFYARAKWAFSALGMSNIGIIITWLAAIISRSLP